LIKKSRTADDYLFHLFVHMNDNDRFVIFNGLSAKQMLQSIDTPSNLLLLKHHYEDGSFNIHTQFDFVEGEDLPLFEKVLDATISDLCWVDFNDERYINQLTPLEQAELLYFAHKKEPLSSPFFVKLQNRFLYYYTLSNNETKIYFRFLADCEIIVAALLSRLIKEKEATGSFWRRNSKRKAPVVDPALLKALRPLAKEGTLVSLYKLDKPNSTYGIELRILSELEFTEEVWEDLDVILKQQFDEYILIS
jgi:hypothetical protein